MGRRFLSPDGLRTRRTGRPVSPCMGGAGLAQCSGAAVSTQALTEPAEGVALHRLVELVMTVVEGPCIGVSLDLRNFRRVARSEERRPAQLAGGAVAR